MQDELYATRVRTELIARAREKAASLGHSQLDFEHLLWADATASNGIVAKLFSSHRVTKFIADLHQFCLSTPREPDSGMICSMPLRLVEESLTTGVAAGGHNLERAAKARVGRLDSTIEWGELLTGVLDYRPHRVVPLLTDYGLGGTLWCQPAMPWAMQANIA